MSVPVRVANAVADLAARARAKLGSRVRDVRLFGSFARGTAHPGSDVDVFLLVDGLDDRERRRLFDLAGDVTLAHLVPIQVLAPSPPEHEWLVQKECRLIRDIMAEGLPA